MQTTTGSTPVAGAGVAAAGPSPRLPIPDDVRAQGDGAIRRYQDAFRLAFQAEAPVNWCEALGGARRRGGHQGPLGARRPSVVRIPLANGCCASPPMPTGSSRTSSSWTGRRPSRRVQRHWVGRSEGAEIDFRTDRGVICDVHHASRHAVRCDVHECSPPSIRLVDLSSPDCLVAERWPNGTPPLGGEARRPHQHRAQPSLPTKSGWRR